MARATAAGGLLLGMAVAGAVLLPTTGTLAMLGDSSGLTAGAGAGVLSLTARVGADEAGPGALVLPERGSGTAQVATTGDLPWTLQVQVLDADGTPAACDVAGRVSVAATFGSAPTGAAGDCSVVLVREGSAEITGAVSVLRDDAPGAWTGLLRVVLQQRPGGFSDVVDIPLELAAPAQVGRTGSTAPSSGGGTPAGGSTPGAGSGSGGTTGSASGSVPGSGPGAGTDPGAGSAAPVGGEGTPTTDPVGSGAVDQPSTPVDSGAGAADQTTVATAVEPDPAG